MSKAHYMTCITSSLDNCCVLHEKHPLLCLFFFLSETMAKAPAIGINLGTSYSSVGVFQNDKVEIIANELGNRSTPNYIAFIDKERLIGEAAKNQIASNPQNTVYSKWIEVDKFDYTTFFRHDCRKLH